MDLSERLKELRGQRGWGQRELANKSGVHIGIIAKAETKITKKLSPKNLQKISDAFEITVKELMSEKMADTKGSPVNNGLPVYEIVSIPYHGVVPAGYPEIMNPVENKNFPVIREVYNMIPDREKACSVRVSGDSLRGDGISHGDYLICIKNSPYIEGKIYLIHLIDTNEVVLKHVFRQNGIIRLVASNGEYKDIQTSNCELLARAIYKVKLEEIR